MSSNTDREKIERGGTRVGATLLALIALALIQSDVYAYQRALNRTRSIYVPVRFEACEHLRDVTLSVTGDAQVFPLGRRIFMFTYYPEHHEVLPDFTEVWIEGEATFDDGVRKIRTNLLVTPERIVSSRDHLDRDHEDVKKQLRIHRDARLPETLIYIKCQDSCGRRSKPAETQVDGAESLEETGVVREG